jgi:hypothetical protein
MRIYFDENFSPRLVAGMQAFQNDRRAEDVTVLGMVDECQANKIGVFFFRPPKNGWSYWSLIQLMVRMWPEITRLARETKRPFGYVVEGSRGRIQAL